MTPKQNDTNEADPKPTVLNQSTLIPLGLVIVFVGQALGIVGYMSKEFASINESISGLSYRMDTVQKDANYRMTTIENQANSKSIDRWTGTDMELWVEKTRRMNPTIQFPDVAPQARKQ